MAPYIIHGGRPGYDRLKVLARSWAATTGALLDRVGLTDEMICLDVGCGAGDVTFELARRVGPGGRVVGLDVDVPQLALAREESERLGFDNIEFRVGDVTTMADRASYDLVYSRNLIQHLERPVEAIRSMWGLVGAGGALAAEDADFEGAFCEPPSAGHDFWLERYQATLRAGGGDPLSGRKLHARFGEAGVPAPELAVVQRLDLTSESKLLPYLTVAGTAETMIEQRIATREEIESALANLTDLANNPSTLLGSVRLFQAWSRRRD